MNRSNGFLRALSLVLLSFPALAQNAPTDRERALLDRIDQLERRLAAIEARMPAAAPANNVVAAPAVATAPAADGAATASPPIEISAYLDGHYTFNENHPYNRTNLLRAYDTTSNNFSLNQATLVVERPVNAAEGRRFGMRVDLMFGQATETLQGSPLNEPRPSVFRHVFQAYGTWLAPVGKGLTVDFGKFASALGFENNYGKDQFNYSRSYLFNFLPFYHMGLRTTYAFSDRVSASYWLVNGAQETEDFNRYKSQAILFALKPAKTVSWNVNYYVGRETHDLPGIPAPDGRMHILDTYGSWNVTPKLTLAGEADYVINRERSNSAPSRVVAGAAYANYAFTPQWSVATRFEYLDDRNGLFGSASQALKENTLTLTYQPRAGFQVKSEWRRDYSNRPYFYTINPAILSGSQNTATLGMIWWFGPKQGAW